MNGLTYWRCKKRMTRQALATAAKLNHYTLSLIEKKGFSDATRASTLVSLAEVLGVTVDQLIDQYDGRDLEEGDRGTYSCNSDNSDNPISVYRREKNLSFKLLAPRLHVTTVEAARQACKRSKPSKKHLKRLSDYEGITIKEFEQKYGGVVNDK